MPTAPPKLGSRNNGPRITRRKVTDPFYGSVAWKRLRAWHRAKHPLCQRCTNEGRTTAMEIVDHVVPIKTDPARALDPTNLQSLCRTCDNQRHAEKGRG